MDYRKPLLLLVIVAAIVGFFATGMNEYMTLAFLQESLGRFEAFYEQNMVMTLALFFLFYVVVTALSLPGAAIMTLAAGALFGLMTGVILVSFASTIGATLAFLVARFLLRDWVQEKFGERLEAINEGVRKDGAYFLFTLRLVPIFPFFLINLVMALTPMRAWTFYWVSQVGMLAGTVVYVNAGTQLRAVEAVGDLLSPALIGSFVLLGLFPWIARGIAKVAERIRVYRGWKKPRSFDRNMVVIGGGSAGLVTAYIGAAVNASVTLVEKNRMGGDCLNTGCVPSKALIRSARVNNLIGSADQYGLKNATAEVDFGAVMDRVHGIIRKIEPHDSVERFTDLGVDVRQGSARIVSPWEVEVEENGEKKRITTRNIAIASGAEPLVPPIPGLDRVDYLTSDTLWSLREQPKRLVVLGGGPIGCELAQAFARLGSSVTQVEMGPRLLAKEDEDAAGLLLESMKESGVTVLTGHKAVAFHRDGQRQSITLEHENGETELEFDQVLVALGRTARTEGMGLEELGIEKTPTGTLELDPFLRTRFPNIYACGDVAGPLQFTHFGAHQAWYVAVNALFGKFKKFKADYSVMPWCTFTTPEVARVGINEQEAREQGVNFEVTRYGLDDLDRAIADGTDQGFVKVLTPPGSDRILGVTIVGEHAGDTIAEYVLAMKHGLGLNKILGTVHIYPTLAEANKFAAGEWKKANAPQWALRVLKHYHAWQLGTKRGN